MEGGARRERERVEVGAEDLFLLVAFCRLPRPQDGLPQPPKQEGRVGKEDSLPHGHLKGEEALNYAQKRLVAGG